MVELDNQAILQAQWEDALLVARLFAVDPQGLGVVLRAKAGPVRARWLSYLRRLLPDHLPHRTMPHAITDDRLLGGLDLGETLKLGRPVMRMGLLGEANGGVVTVAMAERLSLDAASRLSSALDFGTVQLERDGVSDCLKTRFGVVALDEGESDAPEEGTPPALADRLAFDIDLDPFSIHLAYEPLEAEALGEARDLLSHIASQPTMIETLCGAALQLGIFSLRAPHLALRAARAHAALSGRCEMLEEDLHVGVRLVLAPRAIFMPDEAEEDANEQVPPSPSDREEASEKGEGDTNDVLEDRVLDAVKASLPPGLLASLKAQSKARRMKGEVGRHGAQCAAEQRGRPLASRRGDLRAGKRLDVIGTLRAAAPWQKVRHALSARHSDLTRKRLDVRPTDFQIMRYKERAETATIFAVDASGSTALSRLGEAKGAVELLLAESYARRDHVALVSFRNQEADLLLAPTRSLLRAKRALAALPGGGSTPLASGMETAFHLTQDSERRGRTPTFVLLTDGSANIALNGTPGRKAAFEDALDIAKRLRATQAKSLVVDISKRKNNRARALASAMDGHYISLPHADAHSLSNAVRAVQ